MEPQKVTHVLYHADCTDGFGAAWAAWKALGDRATYLPVFHGLPPPELPEEARVLLVDFSYPREELLALRERVADFLVLDHHISAQRELEGLDFAKFDMEHSGAALSWHFFHPGQPLPELLTYIEDWDLWRHRLPDSREVHDALMCIPFEFPAWEGLDIALLRAEGRILLRYQEMLIRNVSDRAGLGLVGGHEIPVVNCPTSLRSEVGHELLKRHPQAPFVGMWSIDARGWQGWSLRSRGDFDVSVLAARLGGGGHVAASGFRLPPGKWILAPLGEVSGAGK
ncbi:MAG: phosphoesterase [Candidatus Xenobium sp.]|jgi:oligoribonuclease NrnB/cAMP/cGMP phosphodiesterase (DHH superfamily)|nr:phosphoesterase [Burkholderiales bacterium]